MTAWEIYWISRLDCLIGVCAVCTFVSFAALVFTPVIGEDGFFFRDLQPKRWFVWWAFLAGISLLVVLMTPSTNYALAIRTVERASQTGGEE